jgi:hypothetical protein
MGVDSSFQPETDDLVQLQRVLGNQGVQRLLAQRKLPLQTKLTVGEADDQYEQEADQVADSVMRMPDSMLEDEEGQPVQAKRISAVQREELLDEEDDPLQREAVPEEDEEALLQAASEPGGVPDVTELAEDQIESRRGSGESLPDSAREFFEPRFGQDFSGVSIHTGAESDTLNRELNARAFTTGQDIFFRTGEYDPESSDGRELLAHELTHVVQQGGSVQLSEDDRLQRQNALEEEDEAVQREAMPEDEEFDGGGLS